MTRSQVMVAACVSSFIVFTVCLAAAIYLSWRLAVADSLGELTVLNRRVITRANIAYEDAVNTLRSMGKSKLSPCSEAHIAQMRQATANNRHIAGVGYFREDVLQCSGWGLSKGPVKKAYVDFVTKDGIKVSVNLRPEVSRSAPRMGLYLDSYGVLINPDVLLDSLTDPDNQFAVAMDNGAIVARRNGPDEQLLQALIARPAEGFNERSFYSAVKEAGWTAVALKPRYDIAAPFDRQAVLFVPLGLIVAFLLIACIMWVTSKQLSPLGELKLAVRQRRFFVLYQPIVEIGTGVCVGAEALVRGQGPDGGAIAPAEFMTIAEASGLILPITDQVIDCVIRDLAPTLRAEPAMYISINLCAADVSTGRVIGVLERKLHHAGVRKEQIWLEVTERGFVDVDGARNTVIRAHEQGHLIAIDDFGTGFSCLQYLERLSIDALKIDKAFVDTIGKITSTSSVLPHIIEIARSLSMVCVAEGVETDEQLAFLREKGVTKAQGWLISRPLCASEFVAFYRSRLIATS